MIQKNFLRACNFYVSEWHLLAAMLPFVRDELKYKNRVVVISQDDLKDSMLKLMHKIDVKFYNSNGIQDVFWCKDYESLEIGNDINPANIFIQGTVEYIEEVNSFLEVKFQKYYFE